MKITSLSGKRICLLGFGKEGQAMLKAIRTYAPGADVTVADKNSFVPTEGAKLQLGDKYLDDLGRFDVIIKSPGIPPQPEFELVKEKMTSGTQIFLDSIAETKAMTVGITGSKGKSTTSSLIYEILKTGGKDASLIGNIGEPAIGHLDEAKPGKIFVMEMSSYQLAALTRSPSIAVVTSFFPEHLDYHGSLENYLEAKKHIAMFQQPGDVIFYDASSSGAVTIANASQGMKIPFSAKDAPVPVAETKLLGEHNARNIAAAYKVSQHMGIDRASAIATIKRFEGLPHRLQNLGTHHGIRWVDDAISTTPESTIAALDALGDSVITIILGGQDRGNDFTGLAKRIKNSSVQTVILFPGSGPRIRKALVDAGAIVKMVNATSMEEAVSIAKNDIPAMTQARMPAPMPETPAIRHPQSTTPIVLLSTASPSYGMFKNFEEKGNFFRRRIRE